MFATIKNLIPEPRQADQPRRYVGRHRQPEPVPPVSPVTPVSPAPLSTATAPLSTATAKDETAPAETTAA